MLSTDNGIEVLDCLCMLVGLWNGKACISNGMVIPQIVKNRITNWSKIPLLCLCVYTEDRWKQRPRNLYARIIHSIHRIETAQMSFEKRINEI